MDVEYVAPDFVNMGENVPSAKYVVGGQSVSIIGYGAIVQNAVAEPCVYMVSTIKTALNAVEAHFVFTELVKPVALSVEVHKYAFIRLGNMIA